MSHEQPALGTCPFCDSPLSPEAILIEYTAGEERRCFVECEECNEPVHPQVREIS